MNCAVAYSGDNCIHNYSPAIDHSLLCNLKMGRRRKLTLPRVSCHDDLLASWCYVVYATSSSSRSERGLLQKLRSYNDKDDS